MGPGQNAWPLRVSRRLCIAFFLVPWAARSEPPLLKATPQFASAAAALDPVNWVMAQGDVGAAARRVLEPAAPPVPAVPERSRNALMQLLFSDSSEDRGLQVAPIRWSGSLGLEQRLVSTGPDSRRSQTLEFASMQMSSYVGQPWLMQVRANIGLITQQESGDHPESGGRGNERGASVTGGATAALFPSSRFPFTASFESNDSRTSGEGIGSDYVNRTLALRQSYRSPLGEQVYGASVERSTLISSSFGRDSVTSITGLMQRSFLQQTLDVSGSYAQNRRSAGEGSDVSRLSARHSYRPSELFNVESYGAFSMNDITAGELDLRSRYLQLNSFATWRPDEESPYFVTGGVRAADAVLDSGGSAAAARTLGVNLAMSYAINPNASLVASGAVAYIGAEGARDVVTTQAVTATYSPPPLPLGPVSYSWNTSASLANQTGGQEGRQHGIGAQVNHQVSKGISLGKAVSLNASANQGASVMDDSLRQPTVTFLHSGSVGLRVNPTAASDAFVSVNLGDSRSQGGRDDRFTLLNLQLSGQLQIGAFSVATANFTLQAVRQQLEAEEGTRTSVQRSGTLSWQHGRLFGVRRLRMVVSATFNELQLESRLLGDPSAPRDQATRLFEQRLQYDIGRLDFRLGTRLATIEGRTDRQFYFRVNRQFGLY